MSVYLDMELEKQSGEAYLEWTRDRSLEVQYASSRLKEIRWYDTVGSPNWELKHYYYRIKVVPRTYECWTIMRGDGRVGGCYDAELALYEWDERFSAFAEPGGYWICHMTGTEVSPEELRELVEQSATEGEV